MNALPVDDADSHVEECEGTWSYLESQYTDRRPIHLDLSGTPGLPRNDSYWLIDGWTGSSSGRFMPSADGASLMVTSRISPRTRLAFRRV